MRIDVTLSPLADSFQLEVGRFQASFLNCPRVLTRGQMAECAVRTSSTGRAAAGSGRSCVKPSGNRRRAAPTVRPASPSGTPRAKSSRSFGTIEQRIRHGFPA